MNLNILPSDRVPLQVAVAVDDDSEEAEYLRIYLDDLLYGSGKALSPEHQEVFTAEQALRKMRFWRRRIVTLLVSKWHSPT